MFEINEKCELNPLYICQEEESKYKHLFVKGKVFESMSKQQSEKFIMISDDYKVVIGYRMAPK